MKELYVTTTKGENFTVDIWANEEPEKVVLRVRDHGLNCKGNAFVPPADIQAIEIRERVIVSTYVKPRTTVRFPNHKKGSEPIEPDDNEFIVTD